MSPRRPRRRARRRSSARPVLLSRRRGGRRGVAHRRTDPGLEPVPGLRRHVEPRPGRAGRGRGRPVQRHVGHGAQPRHRPAGTEPPGAPGRPRQRRAADGRRVVPGRPGRRVVSEWIARTRLRHRLRRARPVHERAAAPPSTASSACSRCRRPGRPPPTPTSPRRRSTRCRRPRPPTASPPPARCWPARTGSTARCARPWAQRPGMPACRRRSGWPTRSSGSSGPSPPRWT